MTTHYDALLLPNLKDPRYNIYWGFIFNDTKKRFRNGTYIHTSLVEDEFENEDGRFIRTLNTVYKLIGREKYERLILNEE